MAQSFLSTVVVALFGPVFQNTTVVNKIGILVQKYNIIFSNKGECFSTEQKVMVQEKAKAFVPVKMSFNSRSQLFY